MGPRMRYLRRDSVAYAAARVLWLLLSAGLLASLGLFTLPTSACHLGWLLMFGLDLVSSALRLTGLSERLEPPLLFWLLPPLHGYMWCLVALIAGAPSAVTPSALHERYGSLGFDPSFGLLRLGSAAALLVPPCALLLCGFAERLYLVAAFDDMRCQLLWWHRRLYVVWALLSPLVPLALWTFALAPGVATDLPSWTNRATAIAVAAAVAANAPVYRFARHKAHEWHAGFGAVRWLESGRGWVLWSVDPRAHQSDRDD
mmetsp:Transcript_28920/g.92670  ORF Transcript_28920/g.92670 Transcript_28920/m.92670 type:complete len:258 (+) Transcript_28920:301-1074(+)